MFRENETGKLTWSDVLKAPGCCKVSGSDFNVSFYCDYIQKVSASCCVLHTPADDKSWHPSNMLPQSTVTAEPKNLNYNTLRKSSMFEHSGIDLQAQYVERPETWGYN